MAGSFGFDNVFMVNGVDVNDNVQGTPNNLFIEDAVQETASSHTASRPIRPVLGRRRQRRHADGGNFFSGSFREGLSNPAWVTQTPLERAGNIKHADILGKTHEGTFGGPLLKDRLWFFGAGRLEKVNTSNTFAQNGGGYTRTDTNRRGEVKFTSTLAPTQMLQLHRERHRGSRLSAFDAAALLHAGTLTTRQLPNRLFGAELQRTEAALFHEAAVLAEAPELP